MKITVITGKDGTIVGTAREETRTSPKRELVVPWQARTSRFT